MLRFSSVQKYTLERMTFIGFVIVLVSIENTVITNCTFQSSSMGQGAIWSQSCTNIDITSSVFQNNNANGSAIFGDGSGGAVYLFG